MKHGMKSKRRPPGADENSSVRLTKEQPSVSLVPGKGASGRLYIGLTWFRGTKRQRLFGSAHIDLDMGCLWELRDGTKGCIQTSGRRFGSLEKQPWIRLEQKPRRHRGIGRRSLTVDLAHLTEYRRILLFTYIEAGAHDWARARPVLTFYPEGTRPIDIWIDEESSAALCAIAVLTCDGASIELRREVSLVPGGLKHLDKAHAWGMKWVLDAGPTPL